MAENTQNVEQFFALYDRDPALRARAKEAEAAWPGSLEIRESVVTGVLLPIAEELGLPFTVKELRAYETRKKMNGSRDVEDLSDEVPEETEFWLLDHGWEEDRDSFDFPGR